MKLPFILVRANKNAVVNGEVSPDQTHYYITLDSPYDVYDDYQILEKLGLGTTTPAALLKLIPSSLYRYLPSYILEHPQSDQFILWEPYDPAFPQNLGEDVSGMNAAHILRAARESSSSHLSSEMEVKEEDEVNDDGEGVVGKGLTMGMATHGQMEKDLSGRHGKLFSELNR